MKAQILQLLPETSSYSIWSFFPTLNPQSRTSVKRRRGERFARVWGQCVSMYVLSRVEYFVLLKKLGPPVYSWICKLVEPGDLTEEKLGLLYIERTKSSSCALLSLPSRLDVKHCRMVCLFCIILVLKLSMPSLLYALGLWTSCIKELKMWASC